MYYTLVKGQRIQVYSYSITSSFTLVILGFEVRHAVDHLPTIVFFIVMFETSDVWYINNTECIPKLLSGILLLP